MNKRIVLTMIAPDKPGLVERVSEVIVSQQGNWLASRMSHLDGMFAGILSISVNEDKAAELIAALEGLGQESGIKMIIEHSEQMHQDNETHVLTVTANDRPGIVNEISHALAGQSANVEELTSNCISAAMSGGNLFRASIKLTLPEGRGIDELRESLESLSDDFMVDLA